MKVDLIKIQQEIDKGNVYSQKHPEYDLWIYKYLPKCAYAREWNEITSICRGLVLDKNGEVVINCIPKFFNHSEPEGIEVLNKHLGSPRSSYTISNKEDGSLIQVALWKDKLIITSSGSFESEQALRAREFINKNRYWFVAGKTYIFEYIYPSNRIVIDYKDRESLILITIKETETGEELNYNENLNFDRVEVLDYTMTFKQIEEELERKDFINKEGYVVKFSNGDRVKFKYKKYFEYHKLFTGINEKLIWKYLSEGKKLLDEVSNVPDELFDFITKTENKLRKMYQGIAIAHRVTFSDYNCDDRKQFAERIKNLDSFSKSILFAMKSEKDYKSIIWKSIEPKVEGIVNFVEKFNEEIL